MPIFLLAVSQVDNINLENLVASFIIIHFLVYPASNGYNSYIDSDEESIGGIEKPPKPTMQLFYTTLVLDILAVSFSFIFVSVLFCLLILLYIAASRAYSSPQIRLKKYPFIGFSTVVIFQGAFTYYMCCVAIDNADFNFEKSIYLLIAATFQIAGAYPLTQVYQHKQDLKDGVLTISYKLGRIGTFIFTAIMFALCNLFYFFHFNNLDEISHFYLLQLFFIPIVSFFVYWFIKVVKNENEANFKNTMLMNKVSSISMNILFIVLIFLNHLV